MTNHYNHICERDTCAHFARCMLAVGTKLEPQIQTTASDNLTESEAPMYCLSQKKKGKKRAKVMICRAHRFFVKHDPKGPYFRPQQ